MESRPAEVLFLGAAERVDSLFVLATQPHLKPGSLLRAAAEQVLEPSSAETGAVFFCTDPIGGSLEHAVAPRQLCASRTQVERLARDWRERKPGPEVTTADPCMFEESRRAFGFPLYPRRPGNGALWIETSRSTLSRARRQELADLAVRAGLLLERLRLRDHAATHGLEIQLVGRSPAILEMEQRVHSIAQDPDAPVLVRGERGSGKELVAYALHYHGSRRDGPFLPVNSAALSDTLYADELFGHERSSFTGAERARAGLLSRAHGGTLFFDELADMPLHVQGTLLRVLDQGELRRIGSDDVEKVDVRFVAATNKDLEKMVAEGSFRSDLYDRLNVFVVRVPTLRERLEDIELLTTYFLKKLCVQRGRHQRVGNETRCSRCMGAPGAACAQPCLFEELAGYDYPGNVRELKNVLTRLASLVVEGELRAEHVLAHLKPQRRNGGRPASGDDMTLDNALRAHIGLVLEMAGGNKSQAARLLGLPLTTLINKMKRLGMQ